MKGENVYYHTFTRQLNPGPGITEDILSHININF